MWWIACDWLKTWHVMWMAACDWSKAWGWVILSPALRSGSKASIIWPCAVKLSENLCASRINTFYGIWIHCLTLIVISILKKVTDNRNTSSERVALFWNTFSKRMQSSFIVFVCTTVTLIPTKIYKYTYKCIYVCVCVVFLSWTASVLFIKYFLAFDWVHLVACPGFSFSIGPYMCCWAVGKVNQTIQVYLRLCTCV